MFDRLRERHPLRIGLQRAAVHFAKAGYEVVSGLGAVVEEVVSALREDSASTEEDGPQKIELE